MTNENMKNKMVELAGQIWSSFETKERDGKRIYRLKDDAPEWMTALVRHVYIGLDHVSIDNGLMEMIRENGDLLENYAFEDWGIIAKQHSIVLYAEELHAWLTVDRFNKVDVSGRFKTLDEALEDAYKTEFRNVRKLMIESLKLLAEGER